MIIIKGHQQGKYQQTVKYGEVDGQVYIYDITCDCMHGTIHPNAWMTGDIICKHIKKVIENEGKLIAT